MNHRKLHLLFATIGILVVTFSCIERYELTTLDYQNVLVIDARITDELKKHQILLKRAYPLENKDFEVESNTDVQILDDLGKVIHFTELIPGQYESNIEFAVQPDFWVD